MAKKMNPILPLAALGLGAFALLAGTSKKASAATPQPAKLPATPAPATAASQSVKVGKNTWKLVPVSGGTDVYAPAGSWGPHGELRVLRFSGSKPRVLVGVADGVPKPVLDAAMKDLAIKTPAGPTVVNPPGKPPMPASLQQELVAAMMALGVDSSGVVRGPVTADSIRRATELSSRLDQAGYPEAGATLRGYAQQAGKLLPSAPTAAPVIPGVPPATAAAIARALELERDPAKLEALKAGLQKLPPSAERDMYIGALDALILQVRTAQAVSQAATDIEQMTAAATAAVAPAAAAATGNRVLKLTSPNMKGEDVRAWQLVLLSSGYDLGKAGADGVFGTGTDTATKDWQKKRGLTADGDVGPGTRAAIGRPPTAPLNVPATAAPRPDPAPKSALEVSAESVATHLRALQAKYGVAGSKGKQDVTLVKRFQSAAGGSADGYPGVGTMLALARAGQGQLPAVMYWPKGGTRAKDLPKYRVDLQAIASAARQKGLTTLASQIEASAARETGAGGLQ